jgi:hypothetical protein
LRKYRNWSLSCIFNEYLLYAAPKSRLEDQRFIENFDVDEIRAKVEASLEPVGVHYEIKSAIEIISGEVLDNDNVSVAFSAAEGNGNTAVEVTTFQ